MSADPQYANKRSWRQRNPDKVRAANKKYRDTQFEKKAVGALAYRIKNRDRIRAAAKARREGNEEALKRYRRDSYLRKRYKITIEQQDYIFAQQNSVCAICKSAEPHGHGHWHVDHCHQTQTIRGILCHFCNIMLGQARDDISILQGAVAYLQKSAPEIGNVPFVPRRKKRHAFRHKTPLRNTSGDLFACH